MAIETSAMPSSTMRGPGEQRPIAAMTREQEADREQHGNRDDVRRAQREPHLVEDDEGDHNGEGRQEYQQENRERFHPVVAGERRTLRQGRQGDEASPQAFHFIGRHD